MTNVWIRLSRGKIHTLEIIRNAVRQFGPQQVRIVNHNVVGKTIELNLGPLSSSDTSDIVSVMMGINGSSGANAYYGRVHTTKANRTVKTLEMHRLKNLLFVKGQNPSSDVVIVLSYD